MSEDGRILENFINICNIMIQWKFLGSQKESRKTSIAMQERSLVYKEWYIWKILLTKQLNGMIEIGG